MGIVIQNRGSSRIKTNYWNSDTERGGQYYLSAKPETAELQLLVPRSRTDAVEKSRKAEFVLVSIGPWPENKAKRGIQFIFEDHSAEPLALVLALGPKDDSAHDLTSGKQWQMSVWVWRDGKPFKLMHLPCKCRRSASLPDFSPFDPMNDIGFGRAPDKAPVPSATPTVSPSTPRNVVGLPRLLARKRGEKLLQLLELDARDARKTFMRERLVLQWARARGLQGVKPTQELIRSFYADRRQRMRTFEQFLDAGRASRFCLERTALAFFKSSLQDTVLDRKVLKESLTEIDNAEVLGARLIASVDQTDVNYRYPWVIWPTLCSELHRWREPGLSALRKKEVILGLFLLVTLSCSMEAVHLAQLIVPRLKREFAKVRLVYRHARRCNWHLLDEDHRERLLVSKQVRRTLGEVRKLRTVEPSVTALDTLRVEARKVRQMFQQPAAMAQE